jgi:hypothetical protein
MSAERDIRTSDGGASAELPIAFECGRHLAYGLLKDRARRGEDEAHEAGTRRATGDAVGERDAGLLAEEVAG